MLRLAVLGYPIAHSVSPALHRAALEALGLEGRYEAWAVSPADLTGAMQRLRDEGYRGANITVPHKEAVVPLVDRLDPSAAVVAAVNTLVCEDGRLVGHNTDGLGFLRSLREEAGWDPAGRCALLLGAGGAARGVATALLQAGAAGVTIANRHRERALRLVEAILVRTPAAEVRAASLDPEELAVLVAGADLLVNCTSVGMWHGAAAGDLPLPARLLVPGMLVADLVYNPQETPLLQAARERGLPVLGGLGMLVYQGAAAFHLWTGREAPVAAMRRGAEQALAAHP